MAKFLRSLSATSLYGSVLTIGSAPEKAIVALNAGAMMRRRGETLDVFCINPKGTGHVGCGGRIGRENHIGLFLSMVFKNARRGISLIDINSQATLVDWERPLGLIIFDGNCGHKYLSCDIMKWLPHLLPGGFVMFKRHGRHQTETTNVVNELIASGCYQREDTSGKDVVLRKLPMPVVPDLFVSEGRRRVLVVTNALYMSGGLLRFERAGRVLVQMGHEVVFCALRPDERQSGWPGVLPVIDLEEAWKQEWDVTMLPGRAGLEGEGQRAWLRCFTDPRFGVRVQHILNDQTYAVVFQDLNQKFLPHIVVFNNFAWRPGDFTQLTANEFHMLVGGVDCKAFAGCRSREKGKEIVIGGQARKNPEPLIACLAILPEHYRLRLYGDVSSSFIKACTEHIASERIELLGVLMEGELPEFYSSVDVVVSTEEFAGWSNLTAEAMAAGIPVICTPAGTMSIAQDEETALVVPSPDSSLIVKALERLFSDDKLRKKIIAQAREKMRQFDWHVYAPRLLKLTEGGRNAHYYWEPDLGIFGKWPTHNRLTGLENVFVGMAGKSVLDIGAAEGLMAKACLDAGAVSVDGMDIDAERLRKARELCKERARFFVADLNVMPGVFQDAPLASGYDVVLYLGVHHHLDPSVRNIVLLHLAALCRETLVLRTTSEVYHEGKLHTLMLQEGFELVRKEQDDVSVMGPLWIYIRQ